MNSIVFLTLVAVVCVLGLVSENFIKLFSPVLFKFLWFYFMFSIVSVPIIELKTNDFGMEIVLSFAWVIYIIFSVYLSIYSIIKLGGIVKCIIMAFLWNFIMVFQFATEKEFVSGMVMFNMTKCMSYTCILVLINIAFMLLTKLVLSYLKKIKKTDS